MRSMSQEVSQLVKRAARSYSKIMGCETTSSEMIEMLNAADPTEKKKYVRWMAERFASSDCIRQAKGLMIANGVHSQAYRILLAFDLCKPMLAIELRNILNYRSINEVDQAVRRLNANRHHCRRSALNRLDMEQVYFITLTEQAGGISVHEPRCIEEAAVLIGNDEILDSTGDALYASLRDIGDILVFVSDAGVLIGAKPQAKGERGVVYDPFGELALFEDLLLVENCHDPVSWGSHMHVLRHMIEIDPSLPFDAEMTEAEPYRIALAKFPLVLHEDREIPDHLREAVLADTDVLASVMGVVL